MDGWIIRKNVNDCEVVCVSISLKKIHLYVKKKKQEQKTTNKRTKRKYLKQCKV